MGMRKTIPVCALLTVVIVGGCGNGESGDGREKTTTPTVTAPTVTASRTVTKSPPPPPAERTTVPPPDTAPRGPATSCTYTESEPSIRRGSTGEGVRQAQCYLNLTIAGLDIPEDGDFGRVTDEATRRFQRCAGITVDGLIAGETWAYLTYWASSSSWVC
jgi:peptidoglycan hydrolase-like protein with peptidoglycan-binding domain